MRRAASVAAALLLAACASGGGGNADEGLPTPGTCMPVDGMLAEGASLAGFDGAYELTLVGPGGAMREGRLVLRERAADAGTFAGASTPLDGSATVDLAGVGAQAVVGLGSEDPAAPGVLVLESSGADGPAVTLRLGSTANRTDRQAVDAAYTVLDVRRIGAGGFFGTWRSGVRMERSQGHFCAWPETPS